MRLGSEEHAVRTGDCVVIPPGEPHKLFNDGAEPLVLLCCCAPAYSDEDTVLTEDPAASTA
jgi:mannose-6-phosphate isomerase-like protein (cupin superfamily)